MSEPDPEIADRVAFMTENMAHAAAEEGEHFVFVRIPGNIGPLERADEYEDPLKEVLHEHGHGEVVGGGSQLGEGDTIAYCGVDVVLTERNQGLKLLKSALKMLKAPKGTVIEEFLPEFCEHPVWDKRAVLKKKPVPKKKTVPKKKPVPKKKAARKK